MRLPVLYALDYSVCARSIEVLLLRRLRRIRRRLVLLSQLTHPPHHDVLCAFYSGSTRFVHGELQGKNKRLGKLRGVNSALVCLHRFNRHMVV